MFFWDPTMVLLIPALLLAFYAQFKVKANFRKYKKIGNRQQISGAKIARRILDKYDLQNVAVEMVQGNLSDHYDPRSKTVALSPESYQGTSIASMAVAAHECGHAIQDSLDYAPLKFRTAILPVANIGSRAAFPLFLIGFFFSIFSLVKLGIIFFAAAVVFQLVTLPVEFNASSRAINIISENGLLVGDELTGAKKVLSAAALTYVASALMALLELLRLILISQMADD